MTQDFQRNFRTGQFTTSIRSTWKASERITLANGDELLRRSAAAAYVGVSTSSLRDWLTRGCPYKKNGGRLLLTKRLVFGRQITYCRRSDLDVVMAAMGKLPRVCPSGIYSLKQASELIGVAPHTLSMHAKKYGLKKMLFEKRVAVNRRRGKDLEKFSRSVRVVGLRKREVDKFVREHALPNRKITVAAFAASLRVSVRTVHNWIEFCPPIGRRLTAQVAMFRTVGGNKGGYLLPASELADVRKSLRGVSRGKDGRPVSSGYAREACPRPMESTNSIRSVEQKCDSVLVPARIIDIYPHALEQLGDKVKSVVKDVLDAAEVSPLNGKNDKIFRVMRYRDQVSESRFIEAVWGLDGAEKNAVKVAIHRFNAHPDSAFQLSIESGQIVKIMR